MADENIYNGVAVDDQRENDVKVSELTKKIEELEREKRELVDEKAETQERIKKLSLEIQGLKSEEAELKEKVKGLQEEIVRSQEANKVSEVIAARAVELETEVSRLQHDWVSAMSEAEEAIAEVKELKKVLGENGKKAEDLEREVELLKQAKAEGETRVKDLEKKIGVLESKEVEEKSKKIRLEEQMREKVGEKENEIGVLKKKVEDLECLVEKKVAEAENLITEKLNLEGELNGWKEKEKMLESRVIQLEEQVNFSASNLRSVEADLVNGVSNGNKGSMNCEAKGLHRLKSQWTLLAVGSTGAVVAAAAVYVCFGKRR